MLTGNSSSSSSFDWTHTGVLGDGMAGDKAISAFLASDPDPDPEAAAGVAGGTEAESDVDVEPETVSAVTSGRESDSERTTATEIVAQDTEAVPSSRRGRRRRRRSERRDRRAAGRRERNARRRRSRRTQLAEPTPLAVPEMQSPVVAEPAVAASSEDGAGWARFRRGVGSRSVKIGSFVVVLVAVGLMWFYEGRIDELEGERTSVEGIAAVVAEHPDTTTFTILRVDRSELSVSVTPDGLAVMDLSPLPSLPDGYTYQIWGATAAQRVSLAVVGSDPGVVSFHLPREVGSMAITSEAAGGVASSSSPAAAFGTVPVGP